MPNRSLMTDDIRGAKPRTLFKQNRNPKMLSRSLAIGHKKEFGIP
jgi:hypothetical protein